jgi:catechol 2,3-dioxygenase-like lactoylglutathione lyase family enzyme
MARRIFHINVNVTDMERSVAFYKLFGFREDRGAETDAPGLAAAFATRSGRIRWTHLQMGEGPELCRLDLVQWYNSPAKAPARKPLDEPGLGRFSILVEDIQSEYRRLRAAGVGFVAPPGVSKTVHGDFWVAVAIDPDNVNVQLIQPPPGL